MTEVNHEEAIAEHGWQPSFASTLLISIFLSAFVFLYIGRARLFILSLAVVLTLLPFIGKFAASHEYAYELINIIFIVYSLSVALYLRPRMVLRKQPWFSKWWGITLCVLIFLLTIFSVRTIFFDSYRVPSASMNPSVPKGSFVVVKKWGFPAIDILGVGMPATSVDKPLVLSRGKVYVYINPINKVSYIHRLIGLPGDTVEIDRESVRVNGDVISRRLLSQQDDGKVYSEQLSDNEYQIIETDEYFPQSLGKWTVPNGHFFFVGDNRYKSADSRYIGFIPQANIVGELLLVF